MAGVVSSLPGHERGKLSIPWTSSPISCWGGRLVVRWAATLAIADIYTDEANVNDVCDIYGKTHF